MCRYLWTRGNLTPVRHGELPPLVSGGGDLAPAAHPRSGFSPLPPAKLKCCAGVPGRLCREALAMLKPRWADPAPCGGSCSIYWDLSGEAVG